MRHFSVAPTRGRGPKSARNEKFCSKSLNLSQIILLIGHLSNTVVRGEWTMFQLFIMPLPRYVYSAVNQKRLDFLEYIRTRALGLPSLLEASTLLVFEARPFPWGALCSVSRLLLCLQHYLKASPIPCIGKGTLSNYRVLW
jgi:hypothetical protein